MIRAAVPADLAGMVDVHLRAFPGFFLSRLGPGALRVYYRTILDHPGGLALVAERPGGRIEGFVAGFRDPAGFYALLRRRRWRIGWAALPYLLRSLPSMLGRVLDNVRRVRSSAGSGGSAQPLDCELSSLAVAPEAGGAGLGQRLVGKFAEAARDAGALAVALTTDARNNDRVNAFYVSLGFSLVGVLERSGHRTMNEYRLSLR